MDKQVVGQVHFPSPKTAPDQAVVELNGGNPTLSPHATADSEPLRRTRPMSGAEYLDSLRDGREVWSYGQRVRDVTAHPAFRNQARMVARMYDALHRPDAASKLTCATDTGSGGFTHRFFKASRTAEEVVADRDAIAAWQRIGHGYMGRSPDYVASFLGVLGANADFFGPYRENALAWYVRSQEQVPFVNHALANPPFDRRLPPDAAEQVNVRVVKETDAGLILSGAKNITTNAPLTNFSFLASDGGTFVKDPNFAVIGILAMDAPGLKVICRPSYEMSAGIVGTPFDYPLSSRLDENDAIFILDNVLMPWENVLVWGDVNRYGHYAGETGLFERSGLQYCTRLAVKLDLISGLLLRAVEAVGIDQFRGVQVSVGEVLNWRHLMWALTDAMAYNVTPHRGVVLPNREGMMAARMMGATAYSRVRQIILDLVASGLVFQPTGARDLKAPELRPYLDRFLRTSDGDAVSRIKLMKTLWDAVGTEFAGRHELYERNNFGNQEAIRLYPLISGLKDGVVDDLKNFVEGCLAECDLDGWTSPDLVNSDDLDFSTREETHVVRERDEALMRGL
ncbi:MAG TPA: 4-hydroxyphenylacetate 3-hydroxylase N-terminal domain-containing protein [Bradyrhizobium sp.]|nr:4-hydroxyphenylacetate 3-hydroxylase N-terminal domain-containing protein [Bradyrhizobium sp.]